jgi:hypothetical protein
MESEERGEGARDDQDEVASEELIQRRAEEQRAVEEAGGGESEGFEQAEQDLIDRAEGGKGGHPLGDGYPAEATDPADHTAYGDADEVASDVDEDPDSPGEQRGA